MSHPVSSTGLPMSMPTLFPEGMYLYIAGASDDLDAGLGNGTPFLFRSDATEPTETKIYCQFRDWVYMAGGSSRWTGAQPGDWTSMTVTAPATTIAANSAQTGNCDLHAPYIVPNETHTGAYDIVTHVPIPAIGDDMMPMGNWNWSTPDTGLGEVTPAFPDTNGSPTGSYVLLNQEMLLNQFIQKLHLLGNGTWSLTMPSIKPARILPQYHVEVLMHNSGHGGLTYAFEIVTARMSTI